MCLPASMMPHEQPAHTYRAEASATEDAEGRKGVALPRVDQEHSHALLHDESSAIALNDSREEMALDGAGGLGNV
jgi:hypothetical protein